MTGTNTAYVTGGPIFALCEEVVEGRLGLFTEFEVDDFNLKSEYKFDAVEILCHRASFGTVYRIQYKIPSREMRCT